MSLTRILNELGSLVMTKNVALAVGSLVLVTVSTKILLKIRWHLKKKSYPKDVVILHQFPRGFGIPSMSPFCLKLETWLRMTNIKYQNELGYSFGPKGKIPFITYNGEDVPDSQFIIEYLGKKLDKDLSRDHSLKDLAPARAFLKMAEESLFWVSGLFRFVHEPNPENLGMNLLLFKYVSSVYKKKARVQGYGLHTKDELFSIGKNDLKALDTFLEGKKYLAGDRPCNEDSAVFGLVSQLVYAQNGTLNKFIKSECPNIVSYVENIKNTYWPDWDDCITNKSKKNK